MSEQKNGSDATPVLECRDLCISYFTRAGEIPAVVDFNLKLMLGVGAFLGPGGVLLTIVLGSLTAVISIFSFSAWS